MKMIKAEEAKVGFTVITDLATFQRLIILSGNTMEEWSAKVTDMVHKERL